MKFMEAEFDRLDTEHKGRLDVRELTGSRVQMRPFVGSKHRSNRGLRTISRSAKGRAVSRSWQKLTAFEGGCMQDLIFVVVAIAFFAVSVGYVRFCDRIR